jgi:cell fate regulator YaaT (PSP1 superfamily)
MSCNGCSTGRGDYGVPAGCGSNGSCGTGGCNKLNVFDWLSGVSGPANQEKFDIVEVRFKNDRKAFYRNVDKIPLTVGDLIATEASPGHDIGTVSITGELVRLQMIKKGVDKDSDQVKKVYRLARENDITKWEEASSLEKPTMMRAREHAESLGLDMKIGDVEYQGDKTKATFYYIADKRVDFRQLIKKYAEDFKIRVEMRQIGARQEASKIGGIGACGRELCCASWLTDFKSVTTNAARYQQLSLNPQKLAGQCGKLKCCLNFELDSYMDALKDFPSTNKKLKTANGTANHFKTDIFKGLLWYFNPEDGGIISLDKDAVKEIIEMNEKGEFPESLKHYSVDLEANTKKVDYENVVGQDDLTRFDSKLKKKKKPSKNRNKNKKQNAGGGGKAPQNKSQGKPQQKGKEGAKNKPKNTGGNKPKPQAKQSGESKKQEGNKGPKKRPQNRKPKPQNKENKGDKE